MSIEYSNDPQEAAAQKKMLGDMAKLAFGSAPTEALQEMIDKAEAKAARLQVVIDDPNSAPHQVALCKLALEQETTMLELYREAQS